MINLIRQEIQDYIITNTVDNKRFFKTTKDSYAENDKFLGISVPILRSISNRHKDLSLNDIDLLIKSSYNEERLLALLILIQQYKNNKDEIYNYYISNMQYVKNWNLVDSSAHLIIGDYAYNKQNTDLIYSLAKSDNLWQKRISIIATWAFIKQNKYSLTTEIAKILLEDKEDLIQKAVGWMLREVGKKEEKILKDFLTNNIKIIKRTTLRYAIERLSKEEKQNFLSK